MPPEQEKPKLRAKRRGCLWKAGIGALIVLPLLGVLVNGPVFRRVATWGIQKGAATQGLTGLATVRGTIFSGIQVEGVEFVGDGTGPIRSVRIGDASVDYSIGELIRNGGLGWLDEVRLSDVEIQVELEEEKGDGVVPAEEESGKESGEKDLAGMIGELLGARYELSDINVAVAKGDKTYEIEGFALHLEPGGGGQLSIDRLEIPGVEPREAIATAIEVKPGALELGPLRILDAVELTRLDVNWASESEPLIAAKLELSGGVVDASYTSEGTIRAVLTEGTVSLPELLVLADVDKLSSGTVKELSLRFRGDFGDPSTWESDISLGLAALEWAPARIDDVTLMAAFIPQDGEDERFHLTAAGKGATLDAMGAFSLADAESAAELVNLPLRVDASLVVAALEDVLVDYLPEGGGAAIPATGALSGELSVEIAGKKLVATHADLHSDQLVYDGVAVDAVRVVADLEALDHLVFDAEVSLDEATVITATGTLDPNTLAYDAKADLKATVNERLEALLAAFGFEKELEAAATVAWEGSGNLKEKQHRGKAEVDATGVRYAGAESLDASLAGSYDDLDIDVSTMSVTSEKIQFRGGLAYRDEVLSLPDLQLKSGELLLLQGRLKVPFAPAVLKSPAEFFAQDGPVDIDIESHDLALESVLELLKGEPPVSCRIDLDLKASGSPSDLELAGALVVEDIKAIPGKHAELSGKVAPARLELDLGVSDRKARVSGRLEQAQIEPFTLRGEMPFTPAAWIDGSADPVDEVVSLSAVMKESRLDFLTSFVPGINSIDGSMGLNVTLAGTLRKPQLRGSGNLRVTSLRFGDSKAPSVRDVSAELRFEDWAVHVDRFEGLLAGGRIAMRGKVGFPEDGPPEFDLRLGGHEVLAHRSDSLSLRTDLDLRLTGPYSAATLAGTIGITSSIFYRDIDLLPISMPGAGGGKSAIPQVDQGPSNPLPKTLDVGVPVEPFRDWKVDVKLVTLDPFRVAGNLVRAGGHCDLTLGGTLGAPVPDGRIWIEEGRVMLPFSRVEISEAEVRFDKSTGFDGVVSLRAEAKTGDYLVSIFGHNRVLDPKLVLTSIPPLPREDILSLLASGTTREQLTAGGGTAATKAFVYYFKSLSNKKGKIDPDAPPTFADTIEERTNVSIGGLDPKSGEMQIDATIRTWRELYIGFGTGQENSYRGILKYIFRFR